jgi:hypothetical protein
MFQALLNNEIAKLRAEKKPFSIETGYFQLSEFSEASGIQNVIPLGNSILIVKQISVTGKFIPNLWTSASTFFQLLSEYENITYKDFDFYHYDSTTHVFSKLPSIHRTKLIIRYDLTTFIEPVIGNIHRASLEYIKINPLKNDDFR